MQDAARPGGRPLIVTTTDGLSGRAERLDQRRMLVKFDDGRSMIVAPDLLQMRGDGTCLLQVPLQQVATGEQVVVPVIREELDVKKRIVEQPRGYRIHKNVRERQQRVIQLLYRDALDVRRVPRHEFVDRPPEVRYEGGTMVIPLCEEVLVVEKRLLLKEEVHVRRREGHIEHAETIVLRSEEAVIERFDDAAASASRAPADAQSPRPTT